MEVIITRHAVVEPLLPTAPALVLPLGSSVSRQDATDAMIAGVVPFLKFGTTSFTLVPPKSPELQDAFNHLRRNSDWDAFRHAYLVHNEEQSRNFLEYLKEVGGVAQVAVHGTRLRNPLDVCCAPQGLLKGNPGCMWGAGIYTTTDPSYVLGDPAMAGLQFVYKQGNRKVMLLLEVAAGVPFVTDSSTASSQHADGPPEGYNSFETPVDYPHRFIITQEPGSTRVLAVLVFN